MYLKIRIIMSSKILELLKQKEEIEKAIIEERERRRVEGIEKAKAIIDEYDLEINDIFPNRVSKSKNSDSVTNKVAPKYRNPENGNTWTGRGKEPTWIAGKDRTLFQI
jgi:DNA-binding protein H-NS